MKEDLSFESLSQFSLILWDWDAAENLQFIADLQSKNQALVCICFSKINEFELRECINKWHLQYFLDLNWPSEKKQKFLKKMWDKVQEENTRLKLLIEYSERNKKLEAMTEDLEQRVQDRTNIIEESNKDQNDKNQKERHLIRFVKDLAEKYSFEDLLQLFRKEIRKYHKIHDPLLVFRIDDNLSKVVFYRSGQYHVFSATLNLDFPKEVQMNEIDLMKKMANVLGRPLSKSIFIPLEFTLIKELLGKSVEAFLCIEHSFQENEISTFLDSTYDQLQCLSMALDRVVLEQQYDEFVYRWVKTFDGIKDPVAIVDKNYNVIRSNKRFKRHSGQKCYQILAGSEAPCPHCPMSISSSDEIRVQHQHYRVASNPIPSSSHYINQYIDITESQELYAKVLQGEKMSALGSLAGNIAHELNNPLTGIYSLAQLLSVEARSDEVKRDLQEIEKAARRSQEIISNLLDYVQDAAHSLEKVSLDETIEKTLPLLKSILRPHRLEKNLDAKDYYVMSVPGLLQQVIFNLVQNACQAHSGSGVVQISTESTEKDLILSISDSGSGIPEEMQDRIFEPFFTTKEKDQGTGLGLSLSKSVIEKFGGKIYFKTQLNKGTTFYIHLPKGNV